MSDMRVSDARGGEVLRGRLSRRRLLGRAAALGLSAPIVAGLLAACGGDASEPTPTSGGSEGGSGSDGATGATPGAGDITPSGGTESAGGESDHWVVALAEEPTGFDAAAQPFTFANFMVEGHVLEPLVDIQGPDLEVTPILAESWETVDDTTWEFKLRPGVKWHNGDDFTSADVKWTIEQLQEAKSGRSYMVTAFTSVEAPDPETVVIKTEAPYGPMIFQLSELVILPQQAWEALGTETFNTQPVGTGPYTLVEWARGQHLIMEANPNWWRGAVTPQRLTFRPITDPATRVAELKAGGVHIIQSVPAAELETLNSGDTRVVNISEGRLMIYPFNTAEPPFDDVRVRQALLYGTDRAEIVDALLGEYGTLLTGPFTPKWMGFNPEVEAYPYDPERAKELLAEAGQSNLEFTWTITDGVFLKDKDVAEALANQLAQIGVKMNLQVTERAKIQQDHQASNFQLTSVAWATATDSDAMLQSIVAEAAHVTDTEVKDLITRARETVDPDERVALYQQVHQRMAEQALWLFVYSQAETYAKRADIPWDGFPSRSSIAVHLMYRLPTA